MYNSKDGLPVRVYKTMENEDPGKGKQKRTLK